MNRRRSMLFSLLALGSFAGCRASEPATEVVVEVHSDLEPGTDLTELQVRIFDEQGKAELTRRKIPLSQRDGQDSFSFPLSYSLAPTGGALDPFRLVVIGRGPSELDGSIVDRVEAQVLGAFRERQRRFVTVFLARSCLERWCRDPDGQRTGQTCVDGQCVDPPVDLGPLEPGAPAGMGRGKTDAGRDAAQSACRADSECKAQLQAVSPEGCVSARCTDGQCQFQAADLDGDGAAVAGCSRMGDPLPGDDCDDRDPTRFPGAWDGPLVAGLHPDACDQRDDDCDGKADDESHEGKSCACDAQQDVDVDCSLRPDGAPIVWPAGTPVGRCRYGKRSCRDGVWGACTGAVEPAERDSCEAENDDNCNGQRNEDCPCVNGTQRPCGSTIGSCKAGTQTCVDARWSTGCSGATVAKASDTCEPGNDDNCNGVPNDGCTCVNGASSTCGQTANARGDCASKPVSCVNGAWSGSCTTTNPELCNPDDRDEDCDGAINEDPPCLCTNLAVSLCGIELGALGDCFWGVALCTDAKWACLMEPANRDRCGRNSDQNCNGIPHEGCACLDDDQRDCPTGTVPSGCTGGRQVCDEDGKWGSCMDYDCPESESNGA